VFDEAAPVPDSGVPVWVSVCVDSGAPDCAVIGCESADCADAADPDTAPGGEAPTVLSCCPPCCDSPVTLPVAPGCSGPLGCGIAGPLLPAAARERGSSFRLMVYDLNGGSSDEVAEAPAEAAPWSVSPGGVWADLPLGPDSSSGTNNTIKMTRMIAPVSLSFTGSSTVGATPYHFNRRKLLPAIPADITP
jgi:hypothetical protein